MVKDKEFEKILQEAEDPKNIGWGSWALPRNATSLEKTKYELCQKILAYQQDNNLSDKELDKRIDLQWEEIEDILFCRIKKLTLDKIVSSINQLFAPCEIKITIKQNRKIIYASSS
ncbi:MAG: hypothetical protein I3273_04295 [Candidatus Moeniiplasma glomeromycotorum]|nr:hypothetical protein [Candidatus Moeniiplasma glomeromycotorum]MCE8169316.1 hypothetical protein [Candidatus Moeniiplasma glomeromycotorum]